LADRGGVVRVPGRPRGAGPVTVRVNTGSHDPGPLDSPPPIGHYPQQPSSEPVGSTSRRFSSRPADRTLSVNGANATCPIIFGNEDLPTGGDIIYAKRFGAVLLVDYFISLGELPTAAIGNIKFSDKAAGSVGATVEIHLGTPGDTTSTLISAYEPTYTVRDNSARVTVKFAWPNQDTGEYNPFDLTCTSKGIICTNLDTLAVEATGNPVMIAHELLTNPIYRTNPYSADDLIAAEWLLGQQQCDFDIGGGVKRWTVAGKIDQQGTLESWIRQILDHCNGHMRHNAGKYGLWLDLPRDRAVDADAAPIKFIDFGDAANMYARASVTHRGKDEVCTVATLDYTDGAAGYIDGSVQDPKPVDIDPDADWIEERFSRPFTTSAQQANRQVSYLKKLKEISRDDFTIPAWQEGILPLEGDRVGLESRRVIPGDQTVPNVDAVPGVEEITIVGQTVSKLGVMLRARPYRDALFDDTLDTTGGPNPPGDDGLSAPDPPTDLLLENVVTYASGEPTVQVKITWTPAAEPYSTFTRILFSRDAGATFDELGTGYQIGPVFLTNPTLGVLHVFRLYTVRTATGQVSTAAEEDLVPAFTDASVPEVTQLRFIFNKLVFYGPIRGGAYLWAPPPAPTLTEEAGAFDTLAGEHAFASSEVTPWGENVMGDRSSITVAAGSRIHIDDIDPTPPALVKKKKLNKTLVDDAAGDLCHVSDMSVGTTSDLWIHDDSGLVSNQLAPVAIEGIRGWEIFDAFGIADPANDPMPLFVFRNENFPPHDYAMLDCTPIVHPDGAGGFAIKVYIRVVMKDGRESVGKYFENLSAIPAVDDSGVSNAIINQAAEQSDSRFAVSGFGKAQYFAGNVNNIVLVDDSVNYDLDLSGVGGFANVIGVYAGGAGAWIASLKPPDEIAFGGTFYGAMIEFVATNQPITIGHEDGGPSTPEWRFGNWPAGTDLVIPTLGRAAYYYDYTASRYWLRFTNF
jgi:hypothetical protein